MLSHCLVNGFEPGLGIKMEVILLNELLKNKLGTGQMKGTNKPSRPSRS
jgi:hypothetical protein